MQEFACVCVHFRPSNGRFLLQVTGHRLQVTGHRLQVTGHRSQVAGHRSQVAGHRLQVTGHIKIKKQAVILAM